MIYSNEGWDKLHRSDSIPSCCAVTIESGDQARQYLIGDERRERERCSSSQVLLINKVA